MENKERTNLICPITGSPLWYVGTERETRDPDSWYSPESDKNIIFARHPFSWNLFRLVDSKSMMAKEKRYFRLNDDNTWTELKKVPHSNELFPKDTPEDDPEWLSAVKNGLERERKRQEQNKYWDEHPNEDPRIKARLIGLDKVEVKPMSAPTGMLFYMDYTYDSGKAKKQNFFQQAYYKFKAWNMHRKLKKSPAFIAASKIAAQQMNFKLDPINPEDMQDFDSTKFPKIQ